MFRNVKSLAVLVCFLLAAIASPAFADNEGQADLDKATQLKVTAETLDDLNEVIDRADSALDKGLDADNKKFAEQLLESSLLQRGQLFAAAVFNVPAQDPQRGMRSMQFRQFALSDLQRAVGMDSTMSDAQLLIGKLQSLPLGDESAARKALSKVVDSKDATPDQKAEAYALRSAVQKKDEDQVADLNKAIELQPDKADYLRLRAQHLFEQQKLDAALADTDSALKMEPDHAATHELRGMILLALDKYDEALKSFDKASELVPEAPLPYQHRGELYRQKGDLQKSLEQLSKALELAPDNVAILLVRAGVYYELKEPEKALADIDSAIKAQPMLAQPHLMKAEILAATNHVDQAIDHLQSLLKSAPGNEQLLNQLGSFYLMANKPRKAIDIASSVLDKDPDNFAARRFRADAYLNIGKHAEAIADFDKALAQKDNDESLLNNFAWVLATSPDDKLRDGARALKLATKAAESSGYETPHILSTLAAAYAETGDYDNAMKWSKKSVELAQKDVDEAKPDDDKSKLETDRDQLKKELESYQDHKPVRERQTAEEAPDAPAAGDHPTTPTAAAEPAQKSALDR
ncbi:MAG TPA: tetratricopeptide repeat protein [Lacipirellulaceae bacterium]|nr:tetratricopeptide repeat protein [Lacipirellulaceae bacterium]